MPRPRSAYPAGYSYHIEQQAVLRQACFREALDRVFYLDCLLDTLIRYGVSLHAFALMDDHIHLLVTPHCSEGISRLMGGMGNRYSAAGSLFEGRHRCCMIDPELSLMRCYRYIDLSPVRAGVVADPEAYYWSSYGFNALGACSELLTPHEVYRSLGNTEKSRQLAYRELCASGLAEWESGGVRHATAVGAIS